ncbi:MAG: DNA-binding protein WhiA [Clostridia bacterium]|nr:DNA-binding protein WhiA [Clostridia bacterium]
MSFSGDVKKEMAAVRPPRGCCRHAFAYGFLESAHAFSEQEISIRTEHAAVAGAYAALLDTQCEGVTYIEQTLPRKTGVYHVVSVPDAGDRQTILAAFGHSGGDTARRLNLANFECETCAAGYLRGAFLACGAITDPETDYHLELTFSGRMLSLDVLKLIQSIGFSKIKHIVRKGVNVLYLKDGEQIADFLAFCGAQLGALTLHQSMMVKEIRNRTNRQVNCESANIDKVIAAATEQVRAIDKIERTIGLSQLPPDLAEIARLRRDNPECSLRELGAMMQPPLSRSGVNHRLQRIVAYADELA